MINEAALDALATAVVRANDPAERFGVALRAAMSRRPPSAGGVRNSAADGVRLDAGRRPGGTLLRLSSGGRSVEYLLDAAEARQLAGYLTGRS